MHPTHEFSKDLMPTPYWPHDKRIRSCKIVGTLGPSSSNEATLRELVEAGLNIVRLNFSHGDHKDHLNNIEMVRRVSKETGRQLSILQDLQGPKIRCGKLLNDKISIEKGKTYRLCFGKEQVDATIIPIDYKDLVEDVRVGQRVMMDDGLLLFKITQVEGNEVWVVAEESGILKNRKGVNFPDSILSLPALTEKDSRDLLFGISNGVDFVALSFVQRAADIEQVKGMISALGSDVPVIAKIEKLSAVETIDAIAQKADGLMVARGDLGVEASVERVPGFQKKIIAAARRHAKPVIIATQMLESMIGNPKASNAEVADVANGVLEGADCLMLSGEMAAGKYPVKSVKRMSEIIETVESWIFEKHQAKHAIYSPLVQGEDSWKIHEAIARSSVEAAHAVRAKAIVCLTLTGSIAKLISYWRPNTPIIAISPRRDVIQRLMLAWGVYGITNPLFYKTDSLLQDIPELLKQMNIVKSGDVIVITAGIPLSKMSATNMIKVNRVP